MTPEHRPEFTRAFARLCSAFGRAFQAEQCDAFFAHLDRYPLGSVLDALKDAPLKSGRFFPSVGLVAELLRDATAAGRGQQGVTSQQPGVYRDGRTGEVQARWQCVACEDTGWRARLASTGELLSNDELVRRQLELRIPRPDGTPTYRMARCPCKGTRSESGSVAS